MIPQSVLDFFHAGKSLPFRSMTFFNFLLEATLAGSVLILVVLVLRMVFRRKIGSRLVYLAWVLVAIRLLLPVAIPNPLMDSLRPTLSTDAGARPVADQIRVRYQDAMSDVSYRLSSSAYENDSAFEDGLADVARELSTYTSYGWLGKAYLLCYAAGALLVALLFAGRHARFRRRLRKNTVGPLEGQQLERYRELCEQLRVKPIPVIYADPLPSPCLVGVFKPVIALPLSLTKDGFDEALMHELSHYKTGDSWWTLLRCVCCVVHWFNPLIWIAQRFVKTDCELACDERVAVRLNREERLHYADTLIRTAKQAYAPRAGVLATGMTMTGRQLKRRIDAILHLKAVQRVAAALVAVALVLLTVAAFSTAESATQTVRLTTDTSAFPFAQSDVYPTPESVPGAPVTLTQLNDAAAAGAQAKRYLCALYPEDQTNIETQYLYQVRQTGQAGWEIVVLPPEDGDTSLYYMELTGAGKLVSVYRTDVFSNGDEQYNNPSVLPANLPDVLLAYGAQVSEAVLQNVALNRITLHEDMETTEGRYVAFDLSSTDDDSVRVSLSAQIAPTFRLTGVYDATDDGGAPTSQPITQGTRRLVYSKDASLAFDAVFWGNTDSRYTLPADTTLTLQQAFDLAVDTMLEKSGLSSEAFLKLTLCYGYYDKSNFEGDISVWRFVWYVNENDSSNRYWVDFQDMPEPPDISLSAPGEGLG